ncbi:hypothetical protein JTB14_009953 [Gonioctena quinquepunctata]|nr:hypothetical protein JTB14_009953 [Gonioctena quinquepunctata]
MNNENSQTIEKISGRFIWHRQQYRVSRDQLHMSTTKGCLDFISIEKKALAHFVKTQALSWTLVFNKITHKFLLNNIFDPLSVEIPREFDKIISALKADEWIIKRGNIIRTIIDIYDELMNQNEKPPNIESKHNTIQ